MPRRTKDEPTRRRRRKRTAPGGHPLPPTTGVDWSRIGRHALRVLETARRAARTLRTGCSRLAASDATPLVLAGLSVGWTLLSGLSLVLVAFGTTVWSVVAVAGATAVGLVAGTLVGASPRRAQSQHAPARRDRSARLSRPLTLAGPVVWWAVGLFVLTAVQSWLVQAVVEAARWLPWSLAGRVAVGLLLTSSAAVLALGLPLFVATALADSLASDVSLRARHSAVFLVAAAVTVLLSANLLAPLFGLNVLRWSAAVLALATAGANLWRRAASAASEPDPVQNAAPSVRCAQSVQAAGVVELLAGLALVTVGLLLAGLTRMLHQLMPVGLWLAASEWALVLLGAGLAGWVVRPNGRRAAAATLALAALGSLLLAAFPLLVQATLGINAFLGHVVVSMPARLALLAVTLLPVGGLAALLVPAGVARTGAGSVSVQTVPFGKLFGPSSPSGRRPFSGLARSLAAVCVGFALGRLLLPLVGTATLVSSCCYVLVALGLARWWAAAVRARRASAARQTDRPEPSERLSQTERSVRPKQPTPQHGLGKDSGRKGATEGERAAERGGPSEKRPAASAEASDARAPWLRAALACAAALAALASPWWSSRFRPDLSAKLLFNSQVFQAKRTGLEPALLPHLDESRCVAVCESGRSTLTVWVCRGATWVVRESGVPKSVVSADPRVNPHYAPELLHAVVPLCLHQRPRRVLLLGLGGGCQLTACLGFPTQQVVCVEPDRALVQLTRQRLARTGEASLDDDRLQLLPVDPAGAL